MPNFSDTIFGFLDENYPSSSSESSSSSPSSDWDGLGSAGAHRNISRCLKNDQDGDDDDVDKNPEEIKAFWNEQEQLLLAALSRTSSTESKILKATNDALRKLKSPTDPIASKCRCQCRSTSPAKPTPEPAVGIDVDGTSCRRCLRVWVAEHLQNTACNSNNNSIITCSIRKSNWKSSPEIPSSKHTYIEFTVEENPSSSSSKNNNRTTATRKRRVIVVELTFRAEFEMARASDEYARIVACLPEVFVGKPERLKTVVKIMCGAAKRCAKDKNVHLAPWRKQSYMLSKWMLTTTAAAAGTTTTTSSAAAGTGVGPGRLFERSTAVGETGKKEVRSGKPRASLLTFALVDALERPHRGPQVVAVK